MHVDVITIIFFIAVSACIQDIANESLVYYVQSNNSNEDVHDFGVVLSFQCILGYNYSTGDLERTCLDSGLWTGQHPTCVSKWAVILVDQ